MKQVLFIETINQPLNLYRQVTKSGTYIGSVKEAKIIHSFWKAQNGKCFRFLLDKYNRVVNVYPVTEESARAIVHVNEITFTF